MAGKGGGVGRGGGKFCPFRIVAFSEKDWYAGKEIGSHKAVFLIKIAKHLPGLSTSLNTLLLESCDV